MRKVDLLFIAFACSMSSVMAQDLIANGSFEQYETRNIVNREGYAQTMNMPTGWNFVKLVDDASGYDAGVTKWGDFILERNDEWGTWEFKGRQTDYSRFFYQAVEAPMGGTVTFSVEVKGGELVSDSDPIIKMECRAGDPLPEDPAYILLSEAISQSQIGSDWSKVSATVTLPAAYTYYVGFSIENVSSPYWLQMQNISLSYETSGVEEVNSYVPRAIVNGNRVKVAGGNHIMIYNSVGQLLQSAEGVEEFESEPLPHGIYIVCVDGQSQKVAISGI